MKTTPKAQFPVEIDYHGYNGHSTWFTVRCQGMTELTKTSGYADEKTCLMLAELTVARWDF